MRIVATKYDTGYFFICAEKTFNEQKLSFCRYYFVGAIVNLTGPFESIGEEFLLDFYIFSVRDDFGATKEILYFLFAVRRVDIQFFSGFLCPAGGLFCFFERITIFPIIVNAEVLNVFVSFLYRGKTSFDKYPFSVFEECMGYFMSIFRIALDNSLPKKTRAVIV